MRAFKRALPRVQRMKQRRVKPASAFQCGEIGWSTRPSKKVMQVVCPPDGKRKVVHAGMPDRKQNQSKKAQKSFRSCHQCERAKAGTARSLACEALWTDAEEFKKFQDAILKK